MRKGATGCKYTCYKIQDGARKEDMEKKQKKRKNGSTGKDHSVDMWRSLVSLSLFDVLPPVPLLELGSQKRVAHIDITQLS